MTLKEKARAYHTAVSEYDIDTVEKMVREDYIQHNPNVPTGRAAFLALIPKLKEFGSKIENIRLFQDGSHIIMHHKWLNAEPFGAPEMAAFHIIRFDGDGLVAEHWNVAEKIEQAPLQGETEIKDLDQTMSNKEKALEWFENQVSKSSPLKYQKQHKIFGEGNFVLSISEATLSGAPTACYDLLRFEKNQIVEQWKVYQEIPSEMAHSNTMFGF